MKKLQITLTTVNLNFSGRWFRVDVNETPEEYFCHIIAKLDVPIYSISTVSHMRPPMLMRETQKFSYKMFAISGIKDVFPDLAISKTYQGTEETQADNEAFDPIAALEEARKRAEIQNPSTNQQECFSNLVIGEGESRATREFELQWWPYLYKSSYGKLTFRFYVEKTIC